MIMATTQPTKADEKAHLRSFIASLPRNSYLASILGDIEPDIVNAITNDLGFIDFSARIEEQREHIAEVARLQNEAKQLENRAKDAQRKIERAENQLYEMRRSLSDLGEAVANLDSLADAVHHPQA